MSLRSFASYRQQPLLFKGNDFSRSDIEALPILIRLQPSGSAVRRWFTERRQQ
jgi:hypothetical protein